MLSPTYIFGQLTGVLKYRSMGDKHRCSICGATFTRAQHVVRHMRSHTGEKPYKCPSCGEQFGRSDLVSRHKKRCRMAKDTSQDGSFLLHLSETIPGCGSHSHGTGLAYPSTTSIETCEECVEGTLLCDGEYPCSHCKIHQRPCTLSRYHQPTVPANTGQGCSINDSYMSSPSTSRYVSTLSSALTSTSSESASPVPQLPPFPSIPTRSQAREGQVTVHSTSISQMSNVLPTNGFTVQESGFRSSYPYPINHSNHERYHRSSGFMAEPQQQTYRNEDLSRVHFGRDENEWVSNDGTPTTSERYTPELPSFSPGLRSYSSRMVDENSHRHYQIRYLPQAEHAYVHLPQNLSPPHMDQDR